MAGCRALLGGRGCPNDKLVLTGSTAGKSVMCEIHKEIIPRMRHLEKLKLNRQSQAGASSGVCSQAEKSKKRPSEINRRGLS